MISQDMLNAILAEELAYGACCVLVGALLGVVLGQPILDALRRLFR